MTDSEMHSNLDWNSNLDFQGRQVGRMNLKAWYENSAYPCSTVWNCIKLSESSKLLFFPSYSLLLLSVYMNIDFRIQKNKQYWQNSFHRFFFLFFLQML